MREDLNIHYLPTYWSASDGMIISEDALFSQMIQNNFAGKAIVLDDYKSHGAEFPYHHSDLHVIAYDEWIGGVIASIKAGENPIQHLRDFFGSYRNICLPDLDLLHGKDSTSGLLAQGILEALPATNFFLIGNQLTVLAPHLLEALAGNTLYYCICTDCVNIVSLR